MEDSAPGGLDADDVDDVACQPSPLRTFVLRGLRAILLLAVTGGLWWALWGAFAGSAAKNSLLHASIPTALLALVALTVLREEKQWRIPARRLARLLPRIRGGRRSIDELSGIGGGLGHVVPIIQDLLREMRQQRQAIKRLELEMSQRVATRTDALERKMGSLRAQATRDALTGLFNRRMLDASLPDMVLRCGQEGLELSVLVADVDRFKALNDTLGHAAGDELLKSIAQILKSGIRDGDIAIRCGGDEFVLLLPACPEHAARALGGRLACIVDALGKTQKIDPPPGLSIGIASLRGLSAPSDPGDAARILLEQADKNLYEVKTRRKAARIGRSAA